MFDVFLNIEEELRKSKIRVNLMTKIFCGPKIRVNLMTVNFMSCYIHEVLFSCIKVAPGVIFLRWSVWADILYD